MDFCTKEPRQIRQNCVNELYLALVLDRKIIKRIDNDWRILRCVSPNNLIRLIPGRHHSFEQFHIPSKQGWGIPGLIDRYVSVQKGQTVGRTHRALPVVSVPIAKSGQE